MLIESGTDDLRTFLQGRGRWTSSVLCRIEATRVVMRRGATAEHLARLGVVLAEPALIPISEAVAECACRVGPPVLRSLDAIHLASALRLAEDLECIVTYDRRLAEAARELGVPVFSPGSDN